MTDSRDDIRPFFEVEGDDRIVANCGREGCPNYREGRNDYMANASDSVYTPDLCLYDLHVLDDNDRCFPWFEREVERIRKALGGYKDSDLASLAESLHKRNARLEELHLNDGTIAQVDDIVTAEGWYVGELVTFTVKITAVGEECFLGRKWEGEWIEERKWSLKHGWRLKVD